MSDTELANKIMSLQSQVETLTQEKSRFEGKAEALDKSLKDLGYDTVEQAVADQEKMEKEMAELTERIEKEIAVSEELLSKIS